MAAGPGAASGSWRQLCGHERGLAAASGSPRGQAAPGPAVRAAWGPAGSGAASAPRTLPSTANKQLLSRGRRGEAAYLLAHFSLRPAKSLPHLFFFPRAGSRKAFCTAALCLAGESRSLRRPLRSRYSRAAAPPCPPGLCSLCSVALEVRSEIARSRLAAGARPRVGILLCRAPPHVQSSSASVCCRNPTVAAEKPQPVLLVLASPFVQMVRDKWRRRSRSDQLKGNAVLSCGASPSSEASNCSSSCAGGWVRGAGSAGGVRAPCRAAAPAFVLRLPVGDLTPGLSGRF